jgi:hypothetical protein
LVRAQKPRRRFPGGGRWCSLVARFPQSDVGGAVFGRLVERDEAAAHPVWCEFRRTDLEVDVGLAARFGELAPAGADFVARSGTDPVIGSCVGGLFDRDDDGRYAEVEVLSVPVKTPSSSWVKGRG